MFQFFHGHPIEHFILAGALLLFLSVLSSKISDKFSVPALAIFLGIGMLAGSEGPGGIAFDNPFFAKSLGIVALCFILFSGGLDTDPKTMRNVLDKGIILSTFGVFVTALIVGLFAARFLDFTLPEGLLLGAIVSSTDAAAVFSILRSKNISLKPPLKPLLEFESGSNDPMAVLLTVGLIQFILNPALTPAYFAVLFAKQLFLGFAAGILMARLFIFIIRRVKLEYEGLYPVLTLSVVLLTYGAAETLKGNGFLAVYIAGLCLARRDFYYKKNLMRFHEGLAWLMQIAMFLTLGLLVFPSRLVPVAWAGLATAAVLLVLARPAAVFLSLLFSRLPFSYRLMTAWVGLRGAAPIVLATFPLLAGIAKSEIIFNLVFFVVIVSVLIQGTSIPLVSKWLKVSAPLGRKTRAPIELEQREGIDADLLEFIVPYEGRAAGRAIAQLNLPQDSLAVLVCRDDKFILAKGATCLEGGDVVLVLTGKANLDGVRKAICDK